MQPLVKICSKFEFLAACWLLVGHEPSECFKRGVRAVLHSCLDFFFLVYSIFLKLFDCSVTL